MNGTAQQRASSSKDITVILNFLASRGRAARVTSPRIRCHAVKQQQGSACGKVRCGGCRASSLRQGRLTPRRARIRQAAADFARRQRFDLNSGQWVPGADPLRDEWHSRDRGRDRADPWLWVRRAFGRCRRAARRARRIRCARLMMRAPSLVNPSKRHARRTIMTPDLIRAFRPLLSE